MNILAYADDIVLVAPSWKSLQHRINSFNQAAAAQVIDMQCNVNKTMCMFYAMLAVYYTQFPQKFNCDKKLTFLQ